jgi:hypothetical protein
LLSQRLVTKELDLVAPHYKPLRSYTDANVVTASLGK